MSFPHPSGFPPPSGVPPFGGGIVVHRARLLPRLLLVAVIMGISFLVTGAIVWFTVLGTADDVRLGRGDGTTRATERGAEAEVGGSGSGVSVPQGWPEALAPPAGATVVSAVATSAGTPDEQLVLVYELEQAGPDAAATVRGQLAVAELTVDHDAVGADGTGSLVATGAGREANVSLSPIPARPGTTTVSWVLRPTGS